MKYLFTHTDLDGVGCAVLARLAFDENVKITYCNYDNVDLIISEFLDEVCLGYEEGDEVYITDISVSEKVAEKIDSSNARYYIHLMDHHKTAEWLNKYSWADVSEYDGELGFKTCGTELFYKHLVNSGDLKATERYHTFVWAVAGYDTWAWKQMKPEEGKIIKELNDLLYILGRDEFIDRCIRRKRVKGDDSMIMPSKDERMLLDRRQNEIDAYIKKKMKESINIICQISDEEMYNCSVVFADRFISELGNRICESDKSIDCSMIFDMGACKISYRTIKPDVDVSKIAAYFGGGGHKAAAGNHFTEWILKCAVGDILYFSHNGEPASVSPKNSTIEETPKKKFKLFNRKENRNGTES